jgi:hypothetical protein
VRSRVRKCGAIGLAAVLVTSAAVQAQDHEHARVSVAPMDPPITITINPEARVSVKLAGALPAPVACGTAAVFRLKIINQGFVTSRLEAELVGEKTGGVMLDFQPEPLKGIPEELRDIRIMLAKPGSADLTVSFRTHNNPPDLGGRDRVHFLMHCI